MILNKDFISYTIDNENVLVCLNSKKFAGVVKLNNTAAFIVNQLKSEKEKDEILSALEDAFSGASEENMKADLEAVIEKLSSVGAIDY